MTTPPAAHTIQDALLFVGQEGVKFAQGRVDALDGGSLGDGHLFHRLHALGQLGISLKIVVDVRADLLQGLQGAFDFAIEPGPCDPKVTIRLDMGIDSTTQEARANYS